nr:putative ribonuclease H-like domain-containing protein [Tanacetum cinerariifolium]
ESDKVIAAKEFGMIAGCDSADALKAVTNLQRSKQMTLPPVILVANLHSTSQLILSPVHQLPVIGVVPAVRPQLVPTGKPKVKPVPTGNPKVKPVPTGKPKVKPVPTGKPKVKSVSIGKPEVTPVPTGTPQVSTPVPTGRPYRPFSVPTDRGYSPSVMSSLWSYTSSPIPHLLNPTTLYFQTYTPYVQCIIIICNMVGIDRQLLLSPQQVVLGRHIEKVFTGYPRTMVDLIHLNRQNFQIHKADPSHNCGRSKSMTGNKDQLDDFQAIHGGKVTFGGDTECLVLSKDFKLPDDSMVVLKMKATLLDIQQVIKPTGSNHPAGTQGNKTNSAGTQDANYDSNCDEQVILVPSYPPHIIQGTQPIDTPGDKVYDSPFPSADEIFRKELAKLKDKEQRVTSDAEELRTPAGVKAVLLGCIPVPTGRVPVPAGSVPVPTGSITVTTDRILVPAGDTTIPTDDVPVHSCNSTDSMFDGEPTTRFPCPSDLGNHDPSPGKYAIGTKWILKNKRDARGIFVCNKARLVAQGHRHEEGDDYDEVFALVARIEVIRLFLAVASYIGILVYQMDVKSAFLNERIEEEVYVTLPKGFVDPHHPKKVYKVVKALYGLHQAPRAWYATFSTFLLKHSYRRGTINKTLFLKKNNRDIILVQVYVDHIVFRSTKKNGLQVQQRPDGIFIHQDKYVHEILHKFDLGNVRTTTTPYEAPKHKSKSESDSPVNVHLYRSMIGQPKLGLWYPKESPLVLEYYSDSDYVGANRDKKSTTGGCQFLGRWLISWQCKKQTIVATSSTKAEYVAAANYCADDGGVTDLPIPEIYSGMDALGYVTEETRVTRQYKVLVFSSKLFANMRLNFAAGSFPSTEDAPLGGDLHTFPPRSSHTPHVGQPSGGAEDPITLTALSYIVSTLVQKVHSLEAELHDHKKLFKDVVGKLVKKVKSLEVNLKTKKRKMVVSDSDEEDGTTPNVDLDSQYAPTDVPAATSTTHADASDIPAGASFVAPGASFVAPGASSIAHGASGVAPDASGIAPGASGVTHGDFVTPTAASAVSADSPKPGPLGKWKRIDWGKEATRRLHEEEMAEMERERAEAQRRRQQEVLESAKFYTKDDWLNIRAQVEANASLSKTLLGDDVSEDNFPTRMAALIKKKRQALADQTLKRPGSMLEEPPTKKPKSPEAPTPSMPEIPISPAVISHPSSRTRRKSFGRKHMHKPKSTLPTLYLDAPAQTFLKVIVDEDSDDEDSVNEVWSVVVGWEILSTPLGDINALYRIDGSTKHFATLRQILHMVDQQDLMKLGKGLFYLAKSKFMGDSELAVVHTIKYSCSGNSFWVFNSPMLHLLRVEMVINSPWIMPIMGIQELASPNANGFCPEQTAPGKDISNPFMAVMVCQKSLGYSNSPLIHILRIRLVINPPG